MENFTRLVEYKKFTLHKSKTSLVGVEIPSKNGKFYPLPIKSEQKIAKNILINLNLIVFQLEELEPIGMKLT